MEKKDLTPQEEEALEEMKRRVYSSASESAYRSQDTLIRMLRAREFNVDTAFEMWTKWVDWRRTYRAEEITEYEMMPHIRTGKAFFHGKDKCGRPCLIVKVRNHWPQDFPPEETLRYSIYLVECAVKLADEEGVGQLCVIYDRGEITDANQDPNFISLARQMASMFNDFYAERLGALYVLHVSWLHWLIYHAVRPTLPKKTREKLHVMRNPSGLREHFDSSELLVEYTCEDPYVHPFPANT